MDGALAAIFTPRALDALSKSGFIGQTTSERVKTESAFGHLDAKTDEIFRALVARPLNPRQRAILAIYHAAAQTGHGALDIETVASALKLQSGQEMTLAEAIQFVRGALRSFGKRLYKTLSAPPPVLVVEDDGEGEMREDVSPLLALLDIGVGRAGQATHELTKEGYRAVSLALGLPENPHDECADDANVAVGMTGLAAALLMRVADSKGLTVDATIKYLTAQAGAG